MELTSLKLIYFSVAVMEYFGKSNLKEKAFILAHGSQSKAPVRHGGKSWQNPEATGCSLSAVG